MKKGSQHLKMLKYKEEDIRKCIALLNEIEVKGLNNAQRVLMVAQALQNPAGEEDGSNR